MVRTEDAVIARYDTHGEKFELLVDPYLAMDVKKGKDVNFDDLLASESVFKDAKKGEVKSEETLNKTFGTTELTAIVKKIIVNGEVQLTTQQRREMMDKKRKEIISLITKNAINPQTKGPHPINRIENAMEEAKIQIDLHKSTQEQIPKIIAELKKLLPISFEKLQLSIIIPAQYTGKGSGIIRKYELKEEKWQNDGSLYTVIEIPAGVKQDVLNEFNNLPHGNVNIKILE